MLGPALRGGTLGAHYHQYTYIALVRCTMLLHPLNPTGLENHLASLQPLMWFLRAVRAASASVTCGPTLFISFHFNAAYRNRHAVPTLAIHTFLCRGKNHSRLSTPP